MLPTNLPRTVSFAILISLTLNASRGAEPVSYERQVKPVLRERCYACHGALQQQASLRLDTAQLAAQGGESGPAVQAGQPAASELVRRIESADPDLQMPPDGERLKPAEIAAIKAWIEQGARGTASEQPEPDPRSHWAFRAPTRPPVPTVADPRWSANPVDAFIAVEHAKRGLTPQPRADKRLWLRRVTLDLVGLPPSLADMDAFLSDESPEAYSRVVERLLDSPQYGERWGRHWMDIWRYSDWWGLGAEVRNSQKHIWHWRDWIIESLNADKGYDQMLREMLAADELYPQDLDRLRATGYLARQYFKFNRTTWLDETIEHTSKAMLGITLNCGKCHDHKYDPFTQLEYYRLRAIFEPYQVRTEVVPGELDLEKDGIPRAFDCNLDLTTFVHVRGDDRNPDKSKVMTPAVPAFLDGSQFRIEPVTLPAESVRPGLRPHVVDLYVRQAEQQIEAARASLEKAKTRLVATRATATATAATKDAATPPASPEPSAPLVRDDFSQPQPEIWEQREGKWQYANGKLSQTQVGASRTALRLKKTPPRDFEARLRFVTTGGDMWKSVGLTFDVAGTAESLVYLSAVAGGSKVQVAFKNGGDYSYPPAGAQARAVEVGKPQELLVRVRGQLVNVVVNGEHSVAYRLPQERRDGALEVITFDAMAEFAGFELAPLSPQLPLVEPTGSTVDGESNPWNVEQAELAQSIAEKTLLAAEGELQSVKLRTTADRLRMAIADPPADPAAFPAEIVAAIQQASQSERQVAAQRAHIAADQARLDLLRSTPEKKAEAEKKLATAMAAWDAAQKQLAESSLAYTSLSGARKTLESNLETEESRGRPFPATSTGRRSAFAKWLTDSRHPLTARVAVNHLWARHFGKPLVPTVFDFGRKGTPPTHPELLDWLAIEFVEHGWSMKHLHRVIVLSETYRLSSSARDASPATLAADPENRFFWRAHSTRMQSQLVRDSLLSLAGDLDLTRGGPSIPVQDEKSRRRSLYFVHSHNDHQKFLSVFDDAGVQECYRRSESIVPQQALALENSSLAVAAAAKIADRLASDAENGTDDEFIRRAFVTVLASPPSDAEFAVSREALQQWTATATRLKRPNPPQSARTHLIQALLNHNDFLTIR